MNLMSYFLTVISIALILLGAVSFTLFIKRLLEYSRIRKNYYKDVNHKLDKILGLLEKKPS